MNSIRRSDFESRIEIMPLIDVIFLLLTFFIYAMVLMIRAELLPVEMQAFASGTPAQPARAMTVSIDRNGALYVDRDQLELDDVITTLQQASRQDPEMVIYVASELEGVTDRLPVFLSLYDRLAFAGLNIKLVGRPDESKTQPAP